MPANTDSGLNEMTIKTEISDTLGRIIGLLEECGWNDEAHWVLDARNNIEGAMEGSEEFRRHLHRLDGVLTGMGSLADLPLRDGSGNRSEQDLRERQWELVGRLGELIEIATIIRLADREEAFYRLTALYIEGPEDLRQRIRRDWDYGVAWNFPDPRRLACTKNEQRPVRERISASLVYDAIEDFRDEDPRDKLVGLAVIYHSCLHAGLDPAEEFEKVASIASADMARLLRDFIGRRPEDKSLKAFMLKVVRNADGEAEILFDA